MIQKRIWPILIGLALILSACRLPMPPTPAPTALPTPSAQPTETATPEPTATVAVPAAADLFTDLPVDAYEDTILTFLNAGGALSDLEPVLVGTGESPTGHAAWSGDVNGDTLPDLIVSLIQPDDASLIPPGRLAVFLSGEEDSYSQVYSWASEPGQGAPQVELLQDLDADGMAEAVASVETCGAHTCFLDVRLLEWDGAGIQALAPASTLELPQPQISVEDGNGDGLFDLVISPTGIGSAGAGPYRGDNQRWVYADGAWTAHAEPQPPQYLIHAIHEGDDMLAAGRLPEARDWYTAVLDQDPALEQSALIDDEVTLLSAFAVFRLVQVSLLSGDTQAADALLQSAVNSPIATGRGTPYVVLAQMYQQAYDGRNPATACEVILGFVRGRESDILIPLGSQTFGYANRDYVAEDFCPPAPAQP